VTVSLVEERLVIVPLVAEKLVIVPLVAERLVIVPLVAERLVLTSEEIVASVDEILVSEALPAVRERVEIELVEREENVPLETFRKEILAFVEKRLEEVADDVERFVVEKSVVMIFSAVALVRDREVMVPELVRKDVEVSELIVPFVDERLPIEPLVDCREIASNEEIVEEVATNWEIVPSLEESKEIEPLVDVSWEIIAPPGTTNEAVDPLTIGSEELMRREPPVDELLKEIERLEDVPPTEVINWLDESSTPVPLDEISREAIVAELVTTR